MTGTTISNTDIDRWQARLAAARGELEVDLLLTGGRVVNVFNGSVEGTAVAIYDGHIVGFGDYPARETYDLKGAYLSPGFIEGHIHVESSKLTPPHFAETVIPHGTTTVVADPHEIANVLGIRGIRYMLESARPTPLDFYYMLPSCVPATHLETAGAELTADDLRPLLDEPDILGIGELMNFPGAYLGDPAVLAKVALAGNSRPVDGHSPGLSGRNLSAYLVAGPSTDHECTTYEEAVEKLARGMRIMIREGSTARNLEALLPLVTPTTERRCMFVSDDRRPGDLTLQGHLDHILRQAVGQGLDPVTALRMVTLNPAEAFGLVGRGAVRPGWLADLTALEDLKSFNVVEVWKKGRLVAKDGRFTGSSVNPVQVPRSGPLPVPPLNLKMFEIPDKGQPVRVIGLVPDQIITGSLTAEPPSENGLLGSDTARDIVKLVVIDRHSGEGRMSAGFIHGLGLQRGALASTVAHDSHNIIAAGVDDRSILTAANRLVQMGGGQVAVEGDNILAELPLPIAGLMSELDAAEVAGLEERLIDAARKLGTRVPDPFMALSFLSLPVIPELKLTDRGLVDVTRFEIVPLYVG